MLFSNCMRSFFSHTCVGILGVRGPGSDFVVTGLYCAIRYLHFNCLICVLHILVTVMM